MANKALQEIWDRLDADRALREAKRIAINLRVERRLMLARAEQARKSKARTIR